MLALIVNIHESTLLRALYSALIVFSSPHADIARGFPFPFKRNINKAEFIPEDPEDWGVD